MIKSNSVNSYGLGRRRIDLLFKDLFDTTTPKQWVMPNSEREENKKEETKEETKDNHDRNNSKNKAVLYKNAKYKKNFSEYIKTDSERKQVYNTISANITTLYAEKRPLLTNLFDDYFTIDSLKCNFNSEAVLQKGDSVTGKRRVSGCSKPYNWEAHHLIPGEAFTVMEATKGSRDEIFSNLHYQLLLMSDYDINHGHNIIALPANGMDFFQPVHNLIQHPSNHTNYTSRVIAEMKKLRKEIKKIEENKKEDHPKISVAIAQFLRGEDMTEDLLWDLLIKISDGIITGKVTKTKIKLNEEDETLVKYKAKSTGTNYKYGALA